MKLLSIEYIPGVEFEALGIVKGTVVQTKNVGKDFMAGMKTLVGGEITGYTEMLNEARQIATKRMVDELASELQGRGYFAEGLHGDMKQSQRDRVMNSFRNGKTEILPGNVRGSRSNRIWNCGEV